VTVDQLDFMEPDPSEEGEEDLTDVKPGAVAEAVVTASDWTTETILNQVRRGNINLNPRFQRRDAWTRARKSKFIESLFLGLPIPQLVLAENRERRGTFLVIDGKQRLLALAQFAAEGDSDFDSLALSGLEVRKDLNDLTLSDLQDEASWADDLAAFDNQTIRTVVVRNWPDDEFLFLVFLRLNTGSVPLSPQELRQALIPGAFMDFVDEFSIESAPLRRALGLDRPDFRMRDVELLIRYFAFTYFLTDYRGNLKKFLDTTCAKLNKRWAKREGELRESAQECERAIEATLDAFGDFAFRRWSGDRFEGRFNRAVFDIMTYYFDDEEVAEAARSNAEKVVSAFKNLCDDDDEFNLALQTTTKTIGATAHRLHAWGNALSEALGVELSVPALAGNRIIRD
jgi:Protein of unknown function DUF262